jgi:sulfatase maturation enzyme AslB (radical SAM superfamily)
VYLIEIYKSIQGESSFAGAPCIFVRLAGCNLRCSWCDSEYTFTGGYKLSEDEVVAEIEKLAPVRLIEFTGGEPLLQERELVPLMERLLGSGIRADDRNERRAAAGAGSECCTQDCGREVSRVGRGEEAFACRIWNA